MEVILFIGIQAPGKSTCYRERLELPMKEAYVEVIQGPVQEVQ